MEETTTTTEAPPLPSPLTRPREGRMIAGVAMGLANRYNLPVLLIRIVFALLTFGGGLGVALYAAGWFLIRSEEEVESPAERLFSGASSTRSWIGIVVVFIAAMILLGNFTFLSSRTVWAIGLLVVGVLLYTGDLPRILNQSPPNPSPPNSEGEVPMTTSHAVATTVPETRAVPEASAPGGDAPAGGGIPPTPTPTPPILPPRASQPKERSMLGRLTIGVILVALGVLAILDNIPGIPLEPQPRHYMALAVTILGLGLVVGGFVGRARWLILLAVVMVPTMLFSPVFEYDWNRENFERVIVPESFGDLEDAYFLDVGNLVIDLSDLPWDGEAITLEAEVDAGNLQIILPPDVGVFGTASVDVGRVAGVGRESSGLGNPSIDFDEPGAEGTIELIAEVDVGNIDIVRVGR